MLKAIIIDDEQTAVNVLSKLLEKYIENVELAGSANSVGEGYNLIKKAQPDVVFLDIEMPKSNGFDLFKKFDEPDFEVIFTTAYNQYAIQAIKFSALDYLLKPIEVEDLKAAIEKTATKRAEKNKSKKLDVFIANLNNLNKQQHKIVLPTIDGFIVVKVEDIIRCEASSNYCQFILTNDQKITVSRTLKEYEELLREFDFLRVHQSHLINLNHVQKYARGNARHVMMADNSQIDISKSKREAFLDVFSALQQ